MFFLGIVCLLSTCLLNFSVGADVNKNTARNEFFVQLAPGNEALINFIGKYYTLNSDLDAAAVLKQLQAKQKQNFEKGNFVKPRKNEMQLISLTDYYDAAENNLVPDLNLIFGTFSEATLAKMYKDPLILSVSLNSEFQLATLNEHQQGNIKFPKYRHNQGTVSLPQLKNSTISQSGGNGVDIYLFDTGVHQNSTHFGERLHKILDYSDFSKNSKQHDHGTNLASIIGSSKIGIAPKSNLYDVKLSENSRTDLFTLLMSIKLMYLHSHRTKRASIFLIPWVSFQKKAHVLEKFLSLIKTSSSKNNMDFKIVVPAGNSPGTSACLISPARCEDVITVGATTSPNIIRNNKLTSKTNFDVAKFSATGDCVDYFAYGYNVNTFCYNNQAKIMGPCKRSGTSISAAVVAAYIALKM